MYVIQSTDQFLRPFQPALQLHPLTGKLEGLRGGGDAVPEGRSRE
ncbi:MAG: hypothetical protein NT178_12275 [Proteobacteria bacterium]|nr:hypothetical protein [Pseudomonadota bacterium]